MVFKYIYIYIYIFVYVYEHHASCVSTVHHVPKFMSCHKTILVITGREHCFHDCISITSIVLL